MSRNTNDTLRNDHDFSRVTTSQRVREAKTVTFTVKPASLKCITRTVRLQLKPSLATELDPGVRHRDSEAVNKALREPTELIPDESPAP